MHYFHSKNLKALPSYCQIWRGPVELAHGPEHILLFSPVLGRMAFHFGGKPGLSGVSAVVSFGKLERVAVSCVLFHRPHNSFLKKTPPANEANQIANPKPGMH